MSTLDVDITHIEKKPRRAPRKRVTAAVEGDAPAKPRARTPRPRSKASAIQVDSSSEVPPSRPLRKAPSRSVESFTQQSSVVRSKVPYIVAACFCVVLGVAAGIGVSDAGQIDVQAKINAQAQSNTASTDNTTVTVPVADSANQAPVAISSLRGRGVGSVSAEPVVDTTTASSSLDSVATSSPDGTATSTSEGTEETSEEVEPSSTEGEPPSAEPPLIEETPLEAPQ